MSISDLLVSLFGCHLVTRLNKTILTSFHNHQRFYNYLLNGFHINTVDKIIYDEEKKAFIFQNSLHNNIELYQEIDKIREESLSSEIELFHKH